MQNYKPTNKVIIKVKADPAKVKEVIEKYNLGKVEDDGLETIYVEQPNFFASIRYGDEIPPAKEVEIEGVNVSVKKQTLLLVGRFLFGLPFIGIKNYPNEENLRI